MKHLTLILIFFFMLVMLAPLSSPQAFGYNNVRLPNLVADTNLLCPGTDKVSAISFNGVEITFVCTTDTSGNSSNNVTFHNLTLTGDLVVAGNISGGFTNGSVLFSDGRFITQDNSQFFWDDINNRLGIGTDSPETSIHIKEAGLTPTLRFESTGVNGAPRINLKNDARDYSIIVDGSLSDSFLIRDNDGFGTNRIVITTGGNVGIGTGTPRELLSLEQGEIILNDSQNIFFGNAEDSSIQFNGSDMIISPADVGTGKLFVATGSDFVVNNTNLFVDASLGRVGIGTTSPAKTLVVKGSSSKDGIVIDGSTAEKYLMITDSSGNPDKVLGREASNIFFGDVDDNGGNIFFIVGGGTKMTLKSNGNFGVGTTNPQAALHLEVSESTTTQYVTQLNKLVNLDTTNDNWVEYTFADTASGASSGAIGFRFTDHGNNFGELHFSTRGSVGGLKTKLYLSQDGLVGINLVDPDAMLEIVTSGTGEEGLHIKGTASQTAALFIMTNSSDDIFFTSGDGLAGSQVVWNEQGTNISFRIEGDTNPNLFFVNASTTRVGIGTPTPQTNLDLVGGIRYNSTRTVTANTVLTVSDNVIFVDANAASLTVTLPKTSVDTIGQKFIIGAIDTAGGLNAVTVNCSSDDKINAVASLDLTADFDGFMIIGINSTDWWAGSMAAGA